jgi:hypothetical protein
MTIVEFEEKHGVHLKKKSECWWARIIGIFWPAFLTRWWTTIRFPFCKGVIAYAGQLDPMHCAYEGILEHELMHVEQQRGAWGLFKSIMLCFFFPMPILFSGRWYIERYPYLRDIQKGRHTIEGTVENLWRYYLLAWPKPLMRAWFESKLNQD